MIGEGDQLLLYTDGVSDVFESSEACPQTRIQTTVEHAASGVQLLNAIRAAVDHDLDGRPQPDDLTLLTAKMLG